MKNILHHNSLAEYKNFLQNKKSNQNLTEKMPRRYKRAKKSEWNEAIDVEDGIYSTYSRQSTMTQQPRDEKVLGKRKKKSRSPKPKSRKKKRAQKKEAKETSEIEVIEPEQAKSTNEDETQNKEEEKKKVDTFFKQRMADIDHKVAHGGLIQQSLIERIKPIDITNSKNGWAREIAWRNSTSLNIFKVNQVVKECEQKHVTYIRNIVGYPEYDKKEQKYVRDLVSFLFNNVNCGMPSINAYGGARAEELKDTYKENCMEHAKIIYMNLNTQIRFFMRRWESTLLFNKALDDIHKNHMIDVNGVLQINSKYVQKTFQAFHDKVFRLLDHAHLMIIFFMFYPDSFMIESYMNDINGYRKCSKHAPWKIKPIKPQNVNSDEKRTSRNKSCSKSPSKDTKKSKSKRPQRSKTHSVSRSRPVSPLKQKSKAKDHSKSKIRSRNEYSEMSNISTKNPRDTACFSHLRSPRKQIRNM